MVRGDQAAGEQVVRCYQAGRGANCEGLTAGTKWGLGPYFTSPITTVTGAVKAHENFKSLVHILETRN